MTDTKAKKDTAPSIPAAVHSLEKALGDARSAKGRIDAKLPASVLLRATQAKGRGRDLSEYDLSSLGEADLKKRKLACGVISAYYSLEKAVKAFRE